MQESLDPVLVKELREAKAALARHGIVIMRTVERELEPAIMVGVRDSLASSPGKLKAMEDEELDALMAKARKAAMKSARELADLHTHLLGKLGIEYIVDLVKELDGINQIFKWDRIAKTVEPVNKLLEKAGFSPVALVGPGVVSEAFALELEEKWPTAFRRFRELAERVAAEIAERGDVDRGTERKRKGPGKKAGKKSGARG